MALRRVLIYLGAIFLMSHIIFCHNAGAVDTIFDMSGYSVINSSASLRVNCEMQRTNSSGVVSNLTQSNVVACSQGQNLNYNILKAMYSVDEWNFRTGDILEFDLLVYTESTGTSFSLEPNIISVAYPFRLLGFKSNDDFKSFDTGVTSYVMYKVYHYSMRWVGGDNVSSSIGFPSSNNYFIFNGDLRFRLFNVMQYRLTGEGSSDQQNEINATNESVQQSESEGASSQSDAQTGTASLISTIGSAVSAITSASPTNCLINGNMGNFDMGQIDLCSNPVPAFVQIISSLILILITVPLCIVMFNRFIGLFRSFQG